MDDYEQLYQKAFEYGIDVFNYQFNSENIKGLYCDGNIALSKTLKTSAQKKCVLQEELGHHFTSSGDIIDLQDTTARKQEHKARVWAYKNELNMMHLIQAYKAGCKNCFEIADYLNITERFLQDALTYYKSLYGLYTIVNHKYILYFEPLGVLETY